MVLSHVHTGILSEAPAPAAAAGSRGAEPCPPYGTQRLFVHQVLETPHPPVPTMPHCVHHFGREGTFPMMWSKSQPRFHLPKKVSS